jgi:hypothetical protein
MLHSRKSGQSAQALFMLSVPENDHSSTIYLVCSKQQVKHRFPAVKEFTFSPASYDRPFCVLAMLPIVPADNRQRRQSLDAGWILGA